jgi:cytochrome c553
MNPPSNTNHPLRFFLQHPVKILWGVAYASFGFTPSFQADPIRYNYDIRPILVEHCLSCHGPDGDKRKADLRLDIEAEAKKQAIVSGNPMESELIHRITSTDQEERMPPSKSGSSLSPETIDRLKQWIKEGAPYQGHWAFEPIRKPQPLSVRDKSKSEIDKHLLASLHKSGLEYSPEITRQQWIRRATFDLIGLPPTWQEVVSFTNDTSPSAFGKVIDRLLESPRYGERWGRHWLDIARYADTHGASAIGFTKFPFSYTYRDYVIEAFNEDLPYNEFIRQQLAADQLGLPDNAPALAGLGFLTIGRRFRSIHDRIDDQIDVVSRGLLGLTIACARCHDHKYDAIPTDDYYSFYATFASSGSPDLLPLIGQPQETEPYQEYQQELQHRQIIYEDMAREQSAVMRGRLRMQVGDYLKALAAGTPEQDLSEKFLSFRTDDMRPQVLERWRTYLKTLSEDDPVFAPWLRLSRMPKAEFQTSSTELVDKLMKENGDQSKQPPMENLGTKAPRWNPRVLENIRKRQPQSLVELAEVYGVLFAEVQQEWLRTLIDTTLEASSSGDIVPDQDSRHRVVNSSIFRQLRRHLYAPGTPIAMVDDEAVKLLNRTVRDNLNGKRGAVSNLHLSSTGSPPRAMILQEENDANTFHVFNKGNPVDRGQSVQARFLTDYQGKERPPFPIGKRRLGLAEAIVDPANPLTRRVIVNWVWQRHFGQGLVRTPDDFGTRGKPPTHPKLLDYLAETLLEEGWSLKRLHKRIMLSSAYKQAALENGRARVTDPENRLLWRMPRQRLDLESMRDSMLAASGELDPTMGGHPFESLGLPLTPRRSVYALVNRDIISPLASTFDGSNPSSCTAKRPETNVPQQTLFALNSEFIQDRAAALAQRLEKESGASDQDRIHSLYRYAFSRLPNAEELEVALNYIQSQSNTDGQTSTPWQRLAHALMASNEFVFVD